MSHVFHLYGDGGADRDDLDHDLAEIFHEIEECNRIADEILALPDPAWDVAIEALSSEIIKIPLTENVTSKFLNRRIRATGGLRGVFMTTLKNAVINRLPVSSTVGMVDDHVQNCFMRLIARDSLRDRLAAGHKITDQQIAMFAVRAGYTDIRDSGTNPVNRELFGARTEREREKGVVTMPITDPRIVWASPDSGEAPGTWIDIADTAANQEDAVQFSQIWKRLEDTIRKHKPNVANRYLGILHAKVEGNTVKDIAEDENVSDFRATAMMSEIRRVLRLEGLDDLEGLAG